MLFYGLMLSVLPSFFSGLGCFFFPMGLKNSFQTWDWEGEHYKFTQYIIDDEDALQVSKFDCEYRAVCRAELTELLLRHGAGSVEWKFPEETGFYQPIVIARRAENR